jgi:hypothetical protein
VLLTLKVELFFPKQPASSDPSLQSLRELQTLDRAMQNVFAQRNWSGRQGNPPRNTSTIVSVVFKETASRDYLLYLRLFFVVVLVCNNKSYVL